MSMVRVSQQRSRMPSLVERPLRVVLNYRAVSRTVRAGTGLRCSPGSRVSSPGRLVVGDFASFGRNCLVDVNGSIGHFFLAAAGVTIVGRDDHATNQIGVPVVLSEWIGDREAGTRDVVAIGDDVWIGAGAIVLSGVRIGHGVVVGAGAIVTTDVPDFSIVAGVPARIMGLRIAENRQVEHLAELQRLRSQLLGQY